MPCCPDLISQEHGEQQKAERDAGRVDQQRPARPIADLQHEQNERERGERGMHRAAGEHLVPDEVAQWPDEADTADPGMRGIVRILAECRNCVTDTGVESSANIIGRDLSMQREIPQDVRGGSRPV